MAASVQAGELHKPVTDSFLWIGEDSGLTKVGIKGDNQPFDATALQLNSNVHHQGQAGVKDLRIVPIKFTNPLNSPGNFLPHNWDLIQDCLNDNSDEDAWMDAAHAGYKEVPLAHNYNANLVQLNDVDLNSGINFEQFDPCEALKTGFHRPAGV